MEPKDIVINSKAPDEHWVSPSGSDTWCTIGQLKGLIAAVCRLSNEVMRLKAMVELDCTQPGVCPDVCTECVSTVKAQRDKYKAALERMVEMGCFGDAQGGRCGDCPVCDAEEALAGHDDCVR